MYQRDTFRVVHIENYIKQVETRLWCKYGGKYFCINKSLSLDLMFKPRRRLYENAYKQISQQ